MQIDKTSGLITTTLFDKPAIGRYAVLVRAADRGRPRILYSTAWLNVVLAGHRGVDYGLVEKTLRNETALSGCRLVTGKLLLFTASVLMDMGMRAIFF